MTSLATLMLDALKAIRRRQELALANVTANAFLLLLFNSWLSVSDRSGADLAVPVLRRFPRFLPWAAAVVARSDRQAAAIRQ